MDSLTQIVLGGAVGEAVLGRKVGNKAVLWGAVAGTIPDLDTLVGSFLDPVASMEIHRGFSHSVVFAILIAPLLGFMLYRLYRKKEEAAWWGWTQLVFWAVFTHPLLDIFTTWGTQLFWPLDWRIALQSIFVIDPLYTLPFLICLLACLFHRRKSPNRAKWNRLGLILSTAYLMLTLIIKSYVNQVFITSVREEGVDFHAYSSRPAPFTSLLWLFNLETENEFILASYSLFDSPDRSIKFRHFQKNHDLLQPLRNHPKVERLIQLTQGNYILEKGEEGMLFHDLRFGLIDQFNPQAKGFVFTYLLKEEANGLEISRKENSFKHKEQLLQSLWKRVKGDG